MSNTRNLILIFLVALFLRFYFLSVIDKTHDLIGQSNTAMWYVDTARHFITGHGLGNDENIKNEFLSYIETKDGSKRNWLDIEEFLPGMENKPEKFRYYQGRSPGYILFMAFVFWLTGSFKIFYFRLAQIGLDSCVCLMLYQIARQFWNQCVGLIAAALYAIWVPAIMVACMVAHDSLMSFAVVLSLWMFSRSLSQFRWHRVLACAASVGLALNVRESALLLVFIFPAAWMLALGLRPAVLKISIFCVAVYAAMIPWSLWNLYHFGEYRFLIHHVGISLFDAVKDAEPEYRQYNWPSSHKDLVERRAGQPVLVRTPEYDQILLSEALGIIERNPSWYAKTVLKRLLQFTILPWSLWQNLSPEPQWVNFKALGGTFWEYLTYYPATVFWRVAGKTLEAVLFLLSIASLIFYRQRWRELAVFVAIPVCSILFFVFMKAQPQYIIPFQVTYFVLAGALIVDKLGLDNEFLA